MNKEQENLYNELVSKYNFNKDQKEQIKLGLENNVDVSIYANPKFNWRQMREIRYGLLNGIEVSIYLNPEFNRYQMQEIRNGLELILDVYKRILIFPYMQELNLIITK